MHNADIFLGGKDILEIFLGEGRKDFYDHLIIRYAYIVPSIRCEKNAFSLSFQATCQSA